MAVAEAMTFDDAMGCVNGGDGAARKAWRDGSWVEIQHGYPNHHRFERTLLLRTPDGTLTPWTPAPDDVRAEDWFDVPTEAGDGHA